MAPDPSKAATEIGDLELGLAWAWIPLVEAWIDEDWARTLAAQEYRKHDGVEIDEEGESDEEEESDEQHEDYRLEDYHGYDPWEDYDSPWDWAPVDVREDWGFSEWDLEEEREGYLPREGPWD